MPVKKQSWFVSYVPFQNKQMEIDKLMNIKIIKRIILSAYQYRQIVLIIYQMKDKEKGSHSEDQDSNSISLRIHEPTQRNHPSLNAELVISKTTQLSDGKKTIKYRDDPVMEGLVTSILRQSDRFPEEDSPVMESQNIKKEELEEYEPNIIRGTLANCHICSEEEKQEYGLDDEGTCSQFDIDQTTRVVVIGKLGYTPLEGAPVQLFLPDSMASFLFLKEGQRKNASLPTNMLKRGERTIVIIQRRIRDSKNILDYCYFVIDPKNLIYPTYLCSWIDCKRRLALLNYVAESKTVNQHTVFGNTCHRMLQWLSAGQLTPQDYFKNPQQHSKRLFESMLYDMYLIKKSFAQFWQTCRQRLKNLAIFFQRYIQNHEEIVVEPYRKIYLKITKIIQSQIMLRSSILGLKGKIDLLLFGDFIDRKNNQTTSVYIPMELKSGRRVSDAHKRQTDIYNILTRETYKHATVGLLYYSDSDIKFFRYEDPMAAYEIVVVHRNLVAQNLYVLNSLDSQPTLPDYPQTFSQCNFCNSSQICVTSYNQCQKRVSERSPSHQHQIIKKQLQSLSVLQKEYVSRWFSWLYKQQRQQNKAFEKNSQMGLFKFKLNYKDLSILLVPQNDEKIRLQVTHLCQTYQQVTCFTDFYKPSLKIRCTIPDIYLLENSKIFSSGFDCSTMIITVTLEFNSNEIKFSQKRLQYFLEEKIDCKVQFQPFANQIYPSLRTTVFNLVKSQHFVKKLALTTQPSQEQGQIEEQQESHSEVFIEGLNQDQNQAFSKAVSSKQFCLIEGMPGTGKTQLIIRLIHYFSKQNIKILVTTFTNRALDNILQRLQDSKRVDSELLIRQGSQFSTAQKLQHFTSKSKKFNSTQDYEEYFQKKKAWFVTLSSLSIHHLPPSFDIVILDEASQCLEPACLQALLRCKKFILIGDYLQLQPLVRSKQVAQQGMKLSFFQRLCINYPLSLVSLKKQYRMNEQIMSLSNQLVYKGKLQLASQQVRTKTLKLMNSWFQIVPLSFQEIINPISPIVFINYDPIIFALAKKYENQEAIIRKVIQTQLPAFIANIFRKLDIASASLAVITALNISVNRIIQLLTCENYRSESVLTIDKSQGIDREVVVLLIERGNEDLVENPRRLNVALTRAKSKLIVVASQEHLERMKVWGGSLARLLKDYKTDLTKTMISQMIKGLSDK